VYLKALIGEHYAHSDAPLFKTLWETYNNCQFVEDEGKDALPQLNLNDCTNWFYLTGDIVFYKDKRGQARRRPAAQYRPQSINAK
jgi:omega-6 fatty acid desaturase (delta-12 desaturase)